MILRLQFIDTERVAQGECRSTHTPEVSIGPRHFEFRGFQPQLLSGRRPWASLGASIAVHLLIGFGAIALAQNTPSENEDRVLNYRVVPIPPKHVTLAPFRFEPPRRVAGARRLQTVLERSKVAKSVGADEGGRQAVMNVRRFELPPDVPRVPSEQTLLQPDTPRDLVPEQLNTLPEFIAWSGESQKLPPMPRKRFVPAGPRETAAGPPQFAEPPKLAPPHPATMAAQSLTIAGVPVIGAKLPLPAPPTAPLRTFRGTPSTTANVVSVDMLPGDPTAIVALNSNPPKLAAGTIFVPPGNQIGYLPPPAEEASVGPQRVTGALGTGANGVGRLAPGEGKSGRGSGTNGGNGGSRNGSPSHEGGRDFSAPLNGVRLNGTVPVRVVHPENGTFDIVISHPSRASDESERLLAGSPVYTVYLSVGTSREWILRYCANQSGRAVQNGNVVTLDNPAPIKPPYPRVTLAPNFPAVNGVQAVLHGYLTAQGVFRQMRAVRAEDGALFKSVESYLSQWEFRPATQDGRPIELEILLLVPRFSF